MIKVRKLVSAFLSIKNDAADSMFDNFEYDGTTFDKDWKAQCVKDKIRYTIASHYLSTISSLDVDASITYADAMVPLFDMQLTGIKRLMFPKDFNLEYNTHSTYRYLISMIANTYNDLYKTINDLAKQNNSKEENGA